MEQSNEKHAQKLQICPITAELEKDTGIFTKQNPYCVMHFGGQDYKTHPDHEAGKKPFWLDQFHIESNKDCKVKIQVYGEVKLLSDSFIGEGAISISELVQQKVSEVWVPLHIKNCYMGRVLLEAKFEGFVEPELNSMSNTGASNSLSEAIQKGGLVEAEYQSGAKAHGLSNPLGHYQPSHEPSADSKTRGTSASLTDILDKWGFQEAKPTKTHGPTNFPQVEGSKFEGSESLDSKASMSTAHESSTPMTLEAQKNSSMLSSQQNSESSAAEQLYNKERTDSTATNVSSSSLGSLLDKSGANLSASTKISGTSNI